MPASHPPTRFDGVRTYAGSCLCGAVRFEADIDLGQGTTRCNCRTCTKTGWWGIRLKPAAFRLLSGEDHLVRHGATPVADHPRCRVCGVEAFGHGNVEEIGGEYYTINVRCLDDVDLEGVPVHTLDGRSDTWAVLATRPYPAS